MQKVFRSLQKNRANFEKLYTFSHKFNLKLNYVILAKTKLILKINGYRSEICL